MELQRIGSTIFPLKDVGIQTGQKLRIEVLNRDISGKAQVRIAGQEITALLEIPADQGEEFWVRVQKIDEKGILLVREKEDFNSKLLLPLSQPGEELMNQALNSLLKEGVNKRLRDVFSSFVQENIPDWARLAEGNGYKILVQLIQGFGFEYERRIKNIECLPEEVQPEEKIKLSKTLKGILLSLLSEEAKSEGKSILSNLLERLTSQQFWLQGTQSEHPFYLLEFPLLYAGEFLTQRLAIKASRKGSKVDIGHCRIALLAQTSNLGEVGIEGWLFEGRLTLKVFGGNPEYLSRLIEENRVQLREQFSRLRINLLSIDVDPLNKAEDFHRFMRGEQREGVDIHV